MTLTENYSSKLGVKIDKPYLLTKFYPTPERYITINTVGGMPAKTYDYWNIVVSFIYPILDKNNIKIVQLGDQNEPRLEGVVYLAGQTDLHQSAYIIKNSLCHVGTDSAQVHIASVFDTPILALYSISPPQICGPYWGNKSKQVLLEPNFEKGSYSYNPNESPKSINTIKPEKVVKELGKILNLEFPDFESLFFGGRLNQIVCETLPNQVVPPHIFQNQILNIRLDYAEDINLEFVKANLAQRPCCIITNKEFNVEELIPFKQHIGLVIVDLNENISTEFIFKLYKAGIKFTPIFDGDAKKLAKLKLELCEITTVLELKRRNTELESLLLDIDPENVFYKTNRIVMSEGKIYISRAAYKEDKPSNVTNQAILDIIDYVDLCEDADFLYVYRLKS